MKKLILIIAILISYSLSSQNFKVEASLLQDIKLATMQDDYENEPFTLDIYTKIKLLNNEDNWHKAVPYYSVLSYEYADLSNPYNRVAFGMGLFYNRNWTNRNWKKIDVGVNVDVNSGMIIRELGQTFFPSFGSDIEVYIMREKVGFTLIGQVVQRSDIDKVRISSLFGLIHKF